MTKTFNDPIHGHITISEFCMRFVDTVQWQRLRDLKQLGTAFFVFPGAVHTRAEHSIGVCYLAERLMKQLQKNQPELGITDRECELVAVAGLCHDLGHGPFSHSFEAWARKHVPEWSHETMSQRLIYHIVEENPLVRASISNEEVALVQRLVAGSPSFSGTIMDGKSSKGGAGDIKSPLTRDWMFQIVCNQLNSIDVDKFDYLMRDSHYLGPFFVGGVHDFSRIMASARVIDNEICYHEKTKHELFQLFQMRYAMYQMVYTHRVSHAVDQMLYDVYDAADSVYKFSANLRDPSKFCSMTDWILLRVEHSRNPALKSARSLVQKIRQRELYSCVGEILLSREVWKSVERMKASSFIVSDSTSTLECSDVRLETILLHHPKCTTKPLQHVRFYSSKNRDRSFILEREQISLLLPMQLEEYKLRVFVTSSQKQSAAEACFQTVMGQWMQKKNKTDGGGGNDKLEDPQQLNSAEKAHSVPQVDGMVSDASSSFSDDANTDGRYEKINLDSIKPPSIPEPRSANVTTPPSNECIIF